MNFPSFSSFPKLEIKSKEADDKKIERKLKKKKRKRKTIEALEDFRREDGTGGTDYFIDKKGNSESFNRLTPIYKRPKIPSFEPLEKDQKNRISFKALPKPITIPSIIDESPGYIKITLEEPYEEAEGLRSGKSTEQDRKLKQKLMKLLEKHGKPYEREEILDLHKREVLLKLRSLKDVEATRIFLKEANLDQIESIEEYEQNLNSIEIMLDYLDYRIKHSSVKHALQIFEECLEKVDKIKSRRDEAIVSIIVKLTAYLAQLGYTERAIAIYQGMIELNCFSKSMGWLEAIGLFEEFWESESPRFGDLGAKGWTEKDTEKEIEDDLQEDEIELDSVTLANFYSGEKKSMFKNWKPKRNSVVENVEDVYQTVLFDDIDPFLFPLKTKEGKLWLIPAFLNHLGLPSASILPSSSFLFKEYYLAQFHSQHFVEDFLNSPENPAISFPMAFHPYLLSESFQWPNLLSPVIIDTLRTLGEDYLSFIDRILLHASNLLPTCGVYRLYLNLMINSKR